MQRITSTDARADFPSRVGRYELVREIGRGGQATVWRALDGLLGVERAIKLLAPGFERSPAEARLLDEARAMARVAHGRVLGIFDVGRDRDRSYIVMEFAPRGTVRNGGCFSSRTPFASPSRSCRRSRLRTPSEWSTAT